MKGLQEGIQQGICIGKEQGIEEVIVGMLNAGVTYQFIADAMRYPIERIAEIDKN